MLPGTEKRIERKNRHLLEVGRALMFIMGVTKHFWCDVVLTAAYLINGMSLRVLNFKTPLDTLRTVYPLSKIFCSFPPPVLNCVAFFHLHSQNRGKLDPRAFRCVFLGYSPIEKGYKCYYPPTRKFFVSIDVIFFDNTVFFTKVPFQRREKLIKIHFG